LGKVVLNKKLTKIVGKFNVEHRLIQEGDRVLVGLSGGRGLFSPSSHIKIYATARPPFLEVWRFWKGPWHPLKLNWEIGQGLEET